MQALADSKSYRLGNIIVGLGLTAPLTALFDLPIYLVLEALFPETYGAGCKAYLSVVTPHLWMSFSEARIWSSLTPCLIVNIHAGMLLQTIAVAMASVAGYASLRESPLASAKLAKTFIGFACLSVAICADIFALGWSTRAFLFQWHYPYQPHLLTWTFMMACYLVLFSIASIPAIVIPAVMLKRRQGAVGRIDHP